MVFTNGYGEEQGWLLVVLYTLLQIKLNETTCRDAYPGYHIGFPRWFNCFTTLDLTSSYWQVELEPCDKKRQYF